MPIIIIELTVRPNPRGYGPYRVYPGQTLLCTVRQPFYDGARELLRRGYSPDAFLTMRHEGSAHRSFVPIPIGQAAKLTVVENDADGLRVRVYEPRPIKANQEKKGLSSRSINSKPEGGTVHGSEMFWVHSQPEGNPRLSERRHARLRPVIA
ncbi:hypothetical protein [Methylobacterium nigriterrae]|uniref:hypothetical protein n=1 Tax=Methylobacterium nigriterrae TaxID=3127512 RepID=UPI0030138AE5